MTTYLRDPEPVARAEHPLVGFGLCGLSVASTASFAWMISDQALACVLLFVALVSLAGIVYGATR